MKFAEHTEVYRALFYCITLIKVELRKQYTQDDNKIGGAGDSYTSTRCLNRTRLLRGYWFRDFRYRNSELCMGTLNVLKKQIEKNIFKKTRREATERNLIAL